MSTPHLLVADWFAPDFEIERRALEPHGMTWSLPEWKPPPPPRDEQVAQLLKRIESLPRIDAVLFLLAPLPAEVINALPGSVQLIQRAGIGLDTIDLEAAQARGFPVDNTPDYAIEEVAVHTLAMMLSLHRQLDATQKVLRAGEWRVQPPQPIERLSTLTLGIVGLGRIGRRVAELARPFVKRVLFFDPVAANPPDWAQSVSLEELLRESDFVSLHAPLLPSTRGLMNAKTLAMMKPDAILINVARGGLVEAPALADAIREKRIAGAALDVYEPEILPSDSPLRELENVILTSHTAWYSRQSVEDCRTQAIEKIVAKLFGGKK